VVPRPQGNDQKRTRLLATVDSVPPGRVASYGQIALEAGLPGRARLVGALLRGLPAGSPLAWHRIVNAQGKSSLDPRSSAGRTQRRRLRSEGVEFDSKGRIDLKRHGWRP